MSDLPPKALTYQSTGEDLRDLVSRLIEDGKDWAAAEIAAVRATVNAWIKPTKIAVPLTIFAIFLLQAALTVLIAALGIGLSRWLGVAGGLAAGAAIALLGVAGLSVMAIRQFKGIGA